VLQDLHCSPDIILVTKWRARRSGNDAGMEEDSNKYVILVGKHEGKRALGRPMHK